MREQKSDYPDTTLAPGDLAPGDVVQLNPQTVVNPMFAACFMTITEPKPWGAQGYVQALGADGQMGGQAHYRATWAEMELVGVAPWVIAREGAGDE